MDTDELEALLQGGRETPSLDFKGPCDWSVAGLIKDFLAMANVQDGGRIVVGVEDKTNKRIGVSAAQRSTYEIDKMKDQVAPYADPFVEFEVEFVADSAGLQFVVITVFPFSEMPVVCSRDNGDVHAGRIYYRPQAGRAQSAPVRSSNDLRTILETAIARRLANLQQIGLVPNVEETAEAAFDMELGDL